MHLYYSVTPNTFLFHYNFIDNRVGASPEVGNQGNGGSVPASLVFIGMEHALDAMTTQPVSLASDIASVIMSSWETGSSFVWDEVAEWDYGPFKSCADHFNEFEIKGTETPQDVEVRPEVQNHFRFQYHTLWTNFDMHIGPNQIVTQSSTPSDFEEFWEGKDIIDNEVDEIVTIDDRNAMIQERKVSYDFTEGDGKVPFTKQEKEEYARFYPEKVKETGVPEYKYEFDAVSRSAGFAAKFI